MNYQRILLKLLFSYLFTGFFGLGLTTIFIYLRDNAITTLFSPVESILFWPYNSLISAQQTFGEQQGQVAIIFATANVILFIFLIITTFKKRY